MTAVSHVKSDTIGDFTGTITGFNSQGSTTTIAATNLVRPSDWNSAHNFFQTISGNTSGDASTASGTNLVIGGTNNATVHLSTGAGAATLWVSGPNAGGGVTYSGYDPFKAAMEPVVGQQGQATWHIQPMNNAPAFQADRMVVPIVLTNSSNSSGSLTLSLWFGVYTRNVSTLSLVTSSSTSVAATMSGTAGSYSQYGGSRILTIPFTTTFGASDYWVGIASRSTTGGTNMSVSQWLASHPNSTHSGVFGAASNATAQRILGMGVYSASSSAVPGSIGFSQINGNSSLFQRAPVFYFASGTV
jgi:hypothetical protein